jgi:hypothetical protein
MSEFNFEMEKLIAEGNEINTMKQAGKDYRSLNKTITAYRESGAYKFD